MNLSAIQKVRSFNRFYTRILGLLDKNLLNSSYTLPEVRVMYEIHHHGRITSREIGALLDMDKGYLSRMLLGFEQKGIIHRKASKTDGRSQVIALTASGKRDFLELNAASDKQVAGFLSRLTPKEIESLTSHMAAIHQILNKVDQEHE